MYVLCLFVRCERSYADASATVSMRACRCMYMLSHAHTSCTTATSHQRYRHICPNVRCRGPGRDSAGGVPPPAPRPPPRPDPDSRPDTKFPGGTRPGGGVPGGTLPARPGPPPGFRVLAGSRSGRSSVIGGAHMSRARFAPLISPTQPSLGGTGGAPPTPPTLLRNQRRVRGFAAPRHTNRPVTAPHRATAPLYILRMYRDPP